MDYNTHWQPASDTMFVLFLGGEVTLDKQQRCWALADEINDTLTDVAEVVIGMNALTVYSTTKTAAAYFTLLDKLNQLTEQFMYTGQTKQKNGKHVLVPVNYGGEYGMDLISAADTLGMSVHELVDAHTKPIYTVYFIGFGAGFPYLEGLPKELHLPRRSKPRLAVPKGSVGIGGSQTGIYPFVSPGGWQLLGQTDLVLFDKTKEMPTLLQAGDTLQFVAEKIIV